jgi:squalene-associated FAD-dependent desaturase
MRPVQVTRPEAAARVHVIGAGLAGLSAAVALASQGIPAILSDAARQAGGRCRSYHDGLLDMVIDNGNHLVLSGNPAVGRYLRAIGAEERLAGPPQADFPFFDLRSGEGWTLRPNDGRLPWWVLARGRRVPGTRPQDYLALAKLMRRHPGRRIDQVLPCRGPLWDRLLRPMLVSILNTPPEEAAADLAGAVVRETLAKGGRATRPRIASPTLAAAFVEPALHHLRQAGTEIRLGRRLRGLGLDGDRVAVLTFAEGEDRLGPQDRVILAVPPWVAGEMLPGLVTPNAFGAIVNAHFRIAPPAHAPAMIGLVGGTAEWVFAFPDRISVTVSAADHLLEMDTQALAERLWRDVATVHRLSGPPPPCRIVKEKRATFKATPDQEARRPPAPTRLTNLFLAGDWTDTGLPATIEGALRSGEAAARFARPGSSVAETTSS